MKTITIRDLRQRWPQAERALQAEHEIIITRDGQPVAKLVHLVPPRPRAVRWNPAKHRKWLKRVFGETMFPSIDEALAADGADRKLL